MANKYFQTIGRRKEAVARVRVSDGNGAITVNGQPIQEVFKGQLLERRFEKPFELTKTIGKYTTAVKVMGGGSNAQLEATIHGISRALSGLDPEFRTILKKQGLLTRDPRARERRKYGLAHAARAMKQSPKR